MINVPTTARRNCQGTDFVFPCCQVCFHGCVGPDCKASRRIKRQRWFHYFAIHRNFSRTRIGAAVRVTEIERVLAVSRYVDRPLHPATGCIRVIINKSSSGKAQMLVVDDDPFKYSIFCFVDATGDGDRWRLFTRFFFLDWRLYLNRRFFFNRRFRYSDRREFNVIHIMPDCAAVWGKGFKGIDSCRSLVQCGVFQDRFSVYFHMGYLLRQINCQLNRIPDIFFYSD